MGTIFLLTRCREEKEVGSRGGAENAEVSDPRLLPPFFSSDREKKTALCRAQYISAFSAPPREIKIFVHRGFA